jgi:hypothetical protein
MKKIAGLMVVGMLWAAHYAAAQSYAETAMMFSRTKPTGSARVLGMGGAQLSLGGDFSSAYSNPAGLGMYNRSEFSISPGYQNLKTSGDYYSGNNLLTENNNDLRTNLNITGLGLVLSRDLSGAAGFIRGTFAITMSRTNNFNRNVAYRGNNPNTSLIDYFIGEANGDTPDQFDSGGALYNTVNELAYNNYLIGPQTVLDPNGDPTVYFTDVSGMPAQEETIQQEGGQNQWNFSYGANLNDKFYIGAGVGIASINYIAEKEYRETYTDDALFDFNLHESLQIRGTGLNLTVGGIARPADFLTIGFSASTPTWYNLTDTWDATMNSHWNNFEYEQGTFLNDESASTDLIVTDYKLVTPWRAGIGATFFFQKAGLITFDLERVNYSSAYYRSRTQGVDYDSDNEKIQGLYKPAYNVRIGGEWRLNAFRLRAGVGGMGDPYATQQNGIDQNIYSYSVGGGYRADKFYIDLAYVHSTTNSSYRPYTIRSGSVEQPLLKYGQSGDNVVATIGFTF